ncbi:hypothetical protein G6F56_005802 [Rhizopus delemar]|nr:hypothetical protein G6F56_005802 [Rhizopus delemar]
MTYNNNLECLNARMEQTIRSNQELIASNIRLDAMVQRQSTELEELKNMFQSFMGNYSVAQCSSNVVVESHTGQALNHRLEEFLRDYKTFRHTSGTTVTATEAEEMIQSEVGCLQVLAHAECTKLEFLLKNKYHTEFKWSEIPKELVLKYVTALERQAADRKTYLNRCKFQWAAYGLLSESWANNFNPNCANKNNKSRKVQKMNSPKTIEKEEESSYESYTS